MGELMEYFIIATHLLLGLILIFMINSPMNIYYKIKNPESFYPDYSVAYVVIENIIGMVLGLLSILGALAFRKGKQWPRFLLPAIIGVLVLQLLLPLIFASARGDKAAYAWTGGVMIPAILLFLVLLIAEVLYFTLKKPTQHN